VKIPLLLQIFTQARLVGAGVLFNSENKSLICHSIITWEIIFFVQYNIFFGI